MPRYTAAVRGGGAIRLLGTVEAPDVATGLLLARLTWPDAGVLPPRAVRALTRDARRHEYLTSIAGMVRPGVLAGDVRVDTGIIHGLATPADASILEAK